MSLNGDKIDPDFFGNHVEDSAQSRTALRNGGVSGVMMARLSRVGDDLNTHANAVRIGFA